MVLQDARERLEERKSDWEGRTAELEKAGLVRTDGAEAFEDAERYTLLSIVDSKWRDHLYDMDYLREGIGWRGLGQRDPLVEYKREGFDLFQEMEQSLKEDYVTYILPDRERRRARSARAGKLLLQRWRRRAEPATERPPQKREGWTQRPVPVRLGQEVQEVRPSGHLRAQAAHGRGRSGGPERLVTELHEKTTELEERLTELEQFFDLGSLRSRGEKLTEEMSRPGFWDDQEEAREISARFSRVENRLRLLEELRGRLSDSGELLELAEEDEELLSEVEGELRHVEQALEEQEVARLFAGEYDDGPAILTINPGAGGVDSQDWADMLSRMYRRWAERREFGLEVIEVTEGEERRHKKRHVQH